MVTTEAQRFIDGHHRKLILVAHPDDESIAASFFLQRQQNAYVVFATNGGFTTQERLRKAGLTGLQQYSSERMQEALNALKLVPPPEGRHFLRFPDGELHLHIDECLSGLCDIASKFKPEFILTHALEAKHIDHDACSFLGAILGRISGIPVWEMPLYHMQDGKIIAQQFTEGTDDSAITIEPSPREVEVKQMMLQCHRTQSTLNVFDELGINVSRPETFRPQLAYEYFNPQLTIPEAAESFWKFELKFHKGRLNYAVHESGHVGTLPKISVPHISFDDPCALCREEGVAKQGSMAHTNYDVEIDLSNSEHILYSVAGGAAEIVCGCRPELKDFGVGRLPSSMEEDLLNLENELNRAERGYCWEDATGLVYPCFIKATEHFENRVTDLKRLAMKLVRLGRVGSDELNLDFAEREELVSKIIEITGEDVQHSQRF